MKNYTALISTLEVVQQGHDEYTAKDKGLLARMESFDLFFGLHLAFCTFPAAEQLSVNLQAKDMTVTQGSKGAELLQCHYKSLRSLEVFGNLYDQVVLSANGITEEPVLPQFRKRPRRLEDRSTPHHYSAW